MKELSKKLTEHKNKIKSDKIDLVKKTEYISKVNRAFTQLERGYGKSRELINIDDE